MTRVEQFELIRRDRRQQNLSIRELAKKHKVHRRAVRQALESAEPPMRKIPARRAPAMDPWADIVQSWLETDQSVPVKQRHTARRVWQRLVDEHRAKISESTVRAFVALVRAELDGNVAQVPIVQNHEPGAEAEVDFGEFIAIVDGVEMKLQLFAMRLSASGKAFHKAFVTCAQEAFLEAHARAFEYFGGVPDRIRYDNLKPAVTKVLMGRERLESERFVLLRSHYGFDAFYCLPGVEGAHEKGGIEGEIGRFRRNHLVPIPVAGSLAEMNELIALCDLRDDARHIDSRRTNVGEDFGREAPLLSTLADEAFDATVHLRARVDAKARISVRQCRYSVPVRLVGKEVEVFLGPEFLEVRHNRAAIVRHERCITKGAEVLVLDHYLETLLAKPGALPGSTALEQARQRGTFSPQHEQLWQTARRRLGDKAGTTVLIDVLLLGRHMASGALLAGIDAALAVGSIDTNVIAIEARRLQDKNLAPVIPIGFAVGRPAPDVANYDTLLSGEQ